MSKSPPVIRSLRAWMDVFMHRSMRGWSQFVKSSGLTMPQLSILMQIHHKGPCGMSQISEGFDISSAAASQLADKLVQSGYLERDEDPSDRRAKLLRLTPLGQKLIADGIEERYGWVDQVTTRLSAEESAMISEALGILTRAAKELDQKTGK